MLRYMSKGRFVPGIAPGSGPAEAMMVGIPEDEVRPRYYSAAAVLEQALTGQPVTIHDGFHELEQLSLTPRWEPRDDQSVWVTVLSAGSAAWTAQRGWNLVTAWLPTSMAAGLADSYREAAEASGRLVSPSQLGLRRRVFVADTDAAAQEKFEAAENLMPLLLKSGSAAVKMEAGDEKVLAMISNPEDYIIGSPETVAEKLVEQCRAGGFGAAFAWHDFAAFGWADMAHSLELFGTRVAPVLRSASVDLADVGHRSGDSVAAGTQGNATLWGSGA
jgi:alkanesulfonate monooxygenase SsuD/methylene tetrahydromethanopterin reductase-like flavin-dependent oxidoreductase (luciferase family)